jgi:hypothetical protein
MDLSNTSRCANDANHIILLTHPEDHWQPCPLGNRQWMVHLRACIRRAGDLFVLQILVLHHYHVSLEQFSFRQDSRVVQECSPKVRFALLGIVQEYKLT